MIKAFKNFIALLVYWSDVLVIGVYALIALVAFFGGMHFWANAQAYFGGTGFPISDYQNLELLKGWIFTLTNTTLLKYVGYAWGYACAAGFSFTLAVLIAHEAIVRFRIRLG